MDWTAQIDGYCERTDLALWSEPLNAVTNLAFIAAAIWLWPRVRRMPGGQTLCAILFVIGIGSGLFHTLATRWAAMADVLPILAFILVYIYLATRDFLGLGRIASVVAVLLFFPYAAATVPLFGALGFLGSSAGYAPIPVLILGYALVLRRRAPATARDMAIGAAILIVSIAFRTLDEPLCPSWPTGTHFLWHLLNATMLSWMILAWRRHRLATPPPPR